MLPQVFCPHLQVPRTRELELLSSKDGPRYYHSLEREGRPEKAVPVGEIVRQGASHTVYRFDLTSDICLPVDSVRVFPSRRSAGDEFFRPADDLPPNISDEVLNDFLIDRQAVESLDVIIFEDTQEVQYLWLILPPISQCHRCYPRQLTDDLYLGDRAIEGFELLKLV